jgi:hypothetical protein
MRWAGVHVHMKSPGPEYRQQWVQASGDVWRDVGRCRAEGNGSAGHAPLGSFALQGTTRQARSGNTRRKAAGPQSGGTAETRFPRA